MVYAPTVMPTKENGVIANGQMVPLVPMEEKGATDDKPKAYIYPMRTVQSSGASDTSTAQSTPSDSRSICDTPDSDPWTIPELRSAGPAWKGLWLSGLLSLLSENIRSQPVLVLSLSLLLLVSM